MKLLISLLAMYAGIWDLDRAASDNIERAIEKTTAPMNFVARPIAKGKLKRRNVAFPRMEITLDDRGVRVRHEQGLNVLYPGANIAVPARAPDGSDLVAKLIPGPPLTLTYDADEGTREDRYTVNPDGTLTIHVRLTSRKLPGPLTYRLVYRRHTP